MSDYWPDWMKEPQARLEGLLSDLAREGKLHKSGVNGMLMHATVVLEFVDEKGEAWFSVLQLEQDRIRELVYHHWLLRHELDGAESPDEEELP
jgi:hypothetical protein